jgi:hypothetical protein
MTKLYQNLLLFLCFLISSALNATPLHYTPPETNFKVTNQKIIFPIITDSPEQHSFFLDLLKQSISLAKLDLSLSLIELPQKRAKQMLKSKELSIYWMIETEQRNNDHLVINYPLTKGLIGQRIFLIRPQDKTKFSSISNLQELKNANLTAGLGSHWFDVEIWNHNKLNNQVYEDNFNIIFQELASKEALDYFPRGAIEAAQEISRHPRLTIEPNLLLTYERDFKFYLARTAGNLKLKEQLEAALLNANYQGLHDKLIEDYWGEDLKTLDLENRIKIPLSIP